MACVKRQTFKTRPISWKPFKEIFESKYYQEAYRDVRHREFLNIRQRDRSVLDNCAEFNKLIEFCLKLVATDVDRCKRFIQRLAPYYLD